MVRVIAFVWLVGVCAAPAAFAQQSELLALLDTKQGKIELVGDLWRLTDRVDLPIPRHTGFRIFADLVEIDLKTERMVATGNVAFTSPDGRITARQVEFNIKDGTAKFVDAGGTLTIPDADRTVFGNQDPDVYFWGEIIEKRGPKQYVIERGFFTTCVQPTPRWAMGSTRMTINLDEHVLAHHTVLRVKGVPLMYVPVMYYPLHDEGRSTGFLMPNFGTSTFRGTALSNGFFWAIGRSQDATFFHDWYTRTGQGAGAEYRYLSGVGSSGTFRVYRLNQRATVFDADEDTAATTLPALTSYQVDAAINQSLGRRLRAQANVEYFSDVSTQQLYHQDTYQRSMSRRMISGGLTGVYGPATLGGYYSRSEQFTDARSSTVYGTTPRATANIAPSRLFGSPVYASLSSEYVFQPNRRLEDGVVIADESLARFDIAPTLRVPLSTLTYLSVTANAAYRSTYFSRSVDASGALIGEGVNRQYMSLQTNVIGPVVSKIWDTPDSTYSDRMKHVIEPTFNFEYITEMANQTRVPATDFSVVAVGGAAKLTYGLTNRLIARTRAADGGRGSTREFLTLGVQQTYYTDPETSRFDTQYVSYSGRPRPIDLSPIAVTARLSPAAMLDANARLEYDVTGNGLQILTAGGSFNTAASSSSLSFSRQRFTPDSETSSYLTASSSWRFAQGRTTAFYGLNWDIDAKYIYSQSLGGAYMAQCCGIRADFQVVNFLSSVSAPIPSDRRLNFAFVLAGLGTFSNFFGLFGGQP
jgi:lipopolysaccharide assembly outer membrane protein LptD (OstA)